MPRIEVIDDETAIAQMYRMRLEAAGMEVHTAKNGKEGLELAEEFRPHLILIDLQMPEMDGEETIRQLRRTEWGKDIPVIVLTNYGLDEAPHALKKLNIESYLIKVNLTPSQVVNHVKQTLEQLG